MIEQSFLDKFFAKDKRIISRAISYVESEGNNSTELLKKIYSKTGKAFRLGITGPPGAGKSTITNELTKIYRAQNKTVGIIAVDPTSPFTGGAVLGDRIRMNDIGKDEGVFIRSMATRGSLGGLSKKAIDAADVLDAAGYDVVIFETVGVGQSELDIARAADSTVVVLVPESGDSIQAMKAGLMEIADIFALNKCDRPGSQQAKTAIQTILALKPRDETTWAPKIIETIAAEKKGLNELTDEIENHVKYSQKNNFLLKKREENSKIRIKDIIRSVISRELWNDERVEALNSAVEEVVKREISPYDLADKIVNDYKLHLTENEK
ncbi:MAG: methylmalonyl Co-A mutase-associated GTPase MeaB [Chlorobi bacterium]|nr:methylmalonyl Co-A mutase-associated GTPase MeaB [Chlorobiota bacterium]